MMIRTEPAERPLWPALGRSGELAAAWSLAGGVAGGLLVAALIGTGRLHPDGALIFATLMTAIGSMLGMTHGAVLGWLGRAHVSADAGRPAWALALFASAAAFVVAIIIAVWLALSASLLRAGSLIGWTVFAFVGGVALAILVWATVLGWHTLEAAYARWPEHRIGTRLVLGSFGVVLAVFLTLRPAVPLLGVRLTTVPLVVVAALATLWIAAPAIVVALRYRRRQNILET